MYFIKFMSVKFRYLPNVILHNLSDAAEGLGYADLNYLYLIFLGIIHTSYLLMQDNLLMGVNKVHMYF